jgi:hypothetical protein
LSGVAVREDPYSSQIHAESWFEESARGPVQRLSGCRQGCCPSVYGMTRMVLYRMVRRTIRNLKHGFRHPIRLLLGAVARLADRHVPGPALLKRRKDRYLADVGLQSRLFNERRIGGEFTKLVCDLPGDRRSHAGGRRPCLVAMRLPRHV